MYTTVSIKISVFRYVTPCNLVAVYQSLGKLAVREVGGRGFSEKSGNIYQTERRHITKYCILSMREIIFVVF